MRQSPTQPVSRLHSILSIVAGATVLVWPTAGPAQVVTLYDSGGFESPGFATGILGSYYQSGSGGQQNWLTTDFNQLLGLPAGLVQNSLVHSGAQAFHINGPRLFNDPTFGGQSFWYRSYPSAATAFNPVANGTPVVSMKFNQYVSGTLINVTDMPLVGIYMEGYTSGGTQAALGSLLLNLNGGVTAITVGGNAVSTADNIYARNSWQQLDVQFNFEAQTYRAFLNGSLLTFGGGLADIPFRNTLNRVAEYGFQASFNQFAGSTTNSAYFDNLVVSATIVPEPSSLAFGAAAIGGFAWLRRRRAH
jgi:hypothetical protein